MKRSSVFFAIAGLAILALVALAQTAQIEGNVIGEDGQPLPNAVVRLTRTDVKQNPLTTKTDKKGHFIYMGLAVGSQWTVAIEVNGKQVDQQTARGSLQSPAELKFDLGKAKKNEQVQNDAIQKALQTGDIGAAEKGLTSEQKDELEARMKANEAALRKNKELSDTYSAAMTAMENKQFADAIAGFQKAVTLDDKQVAVWLGLAEAYMDSFMSKKGADRDPDIQGCMDAYGKALALKPDDAGVHNNYGRALAEAGKSADAQAEMTKAAQLDPPGAGKYYYNLGALLVNGGQNDAAGEVFQKAIAADPTYGDAYYQYGITLMSKAAVAADGTVTPVAGTVEAFQKCIDLGDKCKPEFRQQAKDMIDALHTSVQTTYQDPNKKTTVKKK